MGITCDECGERIEDGDEAVVCGDDKCNSLFCERCALRMKSCPNCDRKLEE